MAAILTLDDGRDFCASNIAISGAFFLISLQLGNHPKLRNWLFDKSHQCAPFFDIDTRGFSSEHRDAFWMAADRAFSEIRSTSAPDFLEQPNAFSANCLNRLIEAKALIDAGSPPSNEVRPLSEPIDLEETWMVQNELEESFAEAAAEHLDVVQSKKRL